MLRAFSFFFALLALLGRILALLGRILSPSWHRMAPRCRNLAPHSPKMSQYGGKNSARETPDRPSKVENHSKSDGGSFVFRLRLFFLRSRPRSQESGPKSSRVGYFGAQDRQHTAFLARCWLILGLLAAMLDHLGAKMGSKRSWKRCLFGGLLGVSPPAPQNW